MTELTPKQAIVALQDFAEAMENVVSDMDSAIRHLQNLESELGGEEASVKRFAGLAQKEAAKKMDGGEFDEERLSKIAAESSKIERSVRKVNQDIESEISELRSFSEELVKLDELSEVAEGALKELEQSSSQ